MSQVANEYQQQALDFLAKTTTKITCEFVENNYHFAQDTDTRDIYNVTIERGSRKFQVRFGQSIVNSTHILDTHTRRTYSMTGKGISNCNWKLDVEHILPKLQSGVGEGYVSNADGHTLVKGTAPTEYDILTCIQKYDPSTFENFCDEFGFSTDSISATKIYEACVKEWNGVQSIWNDEEIELLQEIQ